MSQVFCEWMLAIDVGSKCLNFLGFVQEEMGEFGGRKAQRYPLTMLPQHRNSDRDSVQLQRQTLKLSEMNTREHFCQKRYTGHSSRFSYIYIIYIYFTYFVENCSVQKRTQQPNQNPQHWIFSPQQKRNGKQKIPPKKTKDTHFPTKNPHGPISAPPPLGWRDLAALPRIDFQAIPARCFADEAVP